jgi:hypothetical protein
MTIQVQRPAAGSRSFGRSRPGCCLRNRNMWLDIEAAQERLPGPVHLLVRGAGGPQPQRLRVAAAGQAVHLQPDEGALDDGQLAVVVLPGGAGGELLVQPRPGRLGTAVPYRDVSVTVAAADSGQVAGSASRSAAPCRRGGRRRSGHPARRWPRDIMRATRQAIRMPEPNHTAVCRSKRRPSDPIAARAPSRDEWRRGFVALGRRLFRPSARCRRC